MREAFADRGYTVTDDPSDGALAIATDPDSIETGAVLVVPDEDGKPVETSEFDYTELPQRESWNLCACFIYQNLFTEIDQVPGRAFEGIYPYGYVSDVDASDTVTVGYTEGWIANSGGAITQRNVNGRDFCICTLRVTDRYGDHPIATAVLDRLVDALA
jgi:hypothetical protein